VVRHGPGTNHCACHTFASVNSGIMGMNHRDTERTEETLRKR
jgi:hypothetical protein